MAQCVTVEAEGARRKRGRRESAWREVEAVEREEGRNSEKKDKVGGKRVGGEKE